MTEVDRVGEAGAEIRYVNGVFKGGGAKGVAYAGALEEFSERGLWFRSVTGASAGAITAALVAAGLSPDDIKRAVPAALEAARSSKLLRAGKAAVGLASSLFESKELRNWLDSLLAEQVGKRLGPTDGPVTFSR